MKKGILVLLLLIALGVWLLCAEPISADGIIIPDPLPTSIPDWEPRLTIRYHRVEVSITGAVATTRVDQAFRNDGPVAVEGTYIFPLPPGAVVQRFVLWVDGQPVEGEVLPADEARTIYEGYVRRQRDPALLEYVGRDAVRARIFPIPPGGERRVQLEYTQLLPMEEGLIYYRYPLDTERFSEKPLEQLSVHVTVETESDLRTLYSPSHQDEVVIQREGERRATVSYEASQILPTRDFELYVHAADDAIGGTLLTYAPPDEDGFFLLSLFPAVPPRETVVSRDLFLVLDTSGSMDGEKLAQAKEALAYILRHLNPEDRFNVIAFSTGTRTYASQLRPAGEAEEAIGWVQRLEAMGGTNIYLALSTAFAQADPARTTVVIFLTDGLPTEGITDEGKLLASLDAEAPADVRIFPFGVGYDVNTLFLDQLAQDHGGRPAYVEPHEAIDEKVSALYARIQSPVLMKASLDFGPTAVYDIYPSPLPDLYGGTQLIVVGRYSGDPPTAVTLRGERDGEVIAHTYVLRTSPLYRTDFIPKLWAARKIGYLLTQIRLHGENAEWVDAVVKLSLRYGIITPYTSFLVQEHEEVLSSEGRERAAEEFAAMPTPEVMGEEGVKDAQLRLELGGAQSVPAPEEMAPETSDAVQHIRHVGDKAFICDEEACVDTTFVPDRMTPQEVYFGSEAYRRLIAAHPEWGAYLALAPSCTFVAPDGTAYHFILGEPADEGMPDISPPEEGTTPTTSPTGEVPPATPEPGTPPLLPGFCGGAWLLGAGIILGVWGRRRAVRPTRSGATSPADREGR